MIMVLLLALSAFFSGSETALTFISRYKVKHLFDQKKRGSKNLKRLTDNPQRMLITILVGNNLINISASVFATTIAYQLLSNNVIGIATGVMTFLILVFGEIVPKTLATQHSEAISLFVAGPIWFLSVILWPLIRLWEAMSFSKKGKTPFITEDELKTIVNVGKKEGTIKEAEMIHRVFKFDDISVKDVMTPKTDMKAVNINKHVGDVLTIAASTGYSRFPVFENSKDHIKGVVYVKDILKNRNNTSIEEVMNHAYFVPDTKKIDVLLKQFQKKKINMAIVVNEHGSVIGLVTGEDIVEEIVGEIMDETDKIDPEIIRKGKKSWIVQGKTDIQDVNKTLKLKLSDKEDFSTLGGFILHRLGKFPKKGEEIKLGNTVMKVLNVEHNRIKEVRIEKGKKNKKTIS